MHTKDPTSFYGKGARELQTQFDSKRLADRLADITLHTELNKDDMTLIKKQSTVWIASIDENGWPDVSYKGGSPGFTKIVDQTELHIPNYDGNGMYRTFGNIIDNAKVALLFVDVEIPWRIRIHGLANISTKAEICNKFEGANAVMSVKISRIFPNCGRYIHQQNKISPFVPQPGQTPPIPEWKTSPFLNEFLPEHDPAKNHHS